MLAGFYLPVAREMSLLPKRPIIFEVGVLFVSYVGDVLITKLINIAAKRQPKNDATSS